MTDSRVTQAAVLTLDEPLPLSAVTQAAVLSLDVGASDARVTQTAVLTMYGPPPPHRTTQVAVLSLISTYDCATTRAQCWKITRKDGQVFAYTTHDRDVVYQGVTYLRCNSVKASAISSTANSGTQTGDVQISGILSDAGISARDLAVGLFDDAAVVVHLVDWQTGAGRQLTRGIIARTTLKESTYAMTALTGGARLEQQPLLDVFSPLCRWELGSAQCGVNIEALRVTGSVTALPARNVVNQAQRRIFQDSTRTEPVTTFRNGRLTWTGGLNAGVLCEVKAVEAGGAFTLWQPLPADIALGDTYSIVPGCSKRFTEDCVGIYDNALNFGGFPQLPGNDAINLTPDR